MKLLATATPFEALPPKLWEAIKVGVIALGQQWGVRLVIDDDLSVRDAEHRYGEMIRNAGRQARILDSIPPGAFVELDATPEEIAVWSKIQAQLAAKGYG